MSQELKVTLKLLITIPMKNKNSYRNEKSRYEDEPSYQEEHEEFLDFSYEDLFGEDSRPSKE